MTSDLDFEKLLIAVGRQADSIKEIRADQAALVEAVSKLHTLVVARPAGDEPAPWNLRYASGEQAEDLLWELYSFVEWLTDRYALGTNTPLGIPSCWFRHPYAVEELIALMVAWKAAYVGTTKPSSEPMNWHDRWLWPLLHRLRELPNSWSECRGEHRIPEATGRFGGESRDSFAGFLQVELDGRQPEPADSLGSESESIYADA